MLFVRLFLANTWKKKSGHRARVRDLVVVWPGPSNNLAPGHAHYFDFQYPTCRNMLRPTMLRYVAFKRCDLLAGAFKCFANNVGICCVKMLRTFRRGFAHEALAFESQPS